MITIEESLRGTKQLLIFYHNANENEIPECLGSINSPGTFRFTNEEREVIQRALNEPMQRALLSTNEIGIRP